VTLHTCGKALGVAGALVAANGTLIDFMVNRARPFIYSTAPPPLVAAVVRAALRLIDREPERRRHLADLVDHAGALLQSRVGLAASGTQIVPVMLGSDELALRVAGSLQSAGFDCRAIRPPTVPEGTARLRLSITLNVDCKIVATMIDELATTLRREAA
jgi:8-amino-7-oxononanoate synthase